MHTIPVALRADFKLIRNSVLLLSELLDIQVVTRVLVWRERVTNGLRNCVVGMKTELVLLRASDHPKSQADTLWTLQNGCEVLMIAGNMCIMWVNLVHIFPFSDRLLTLQQFKATHVDFGTAHDSRGVHISPWYFVKSR